MKAAAAQAGMAGGLICEGNNDLEIPKPSLLLKPQICDVRGLFPKPYEECNDQVGSVLTSKAIFGAGRKFNFSSRMLKTFKEEKGNLC